MGLTFRFYLPLVAVVVAGFAVAIWYIRPAPPTSIRLATGTADGAYARFGESLQAYLAAQGVQVALVASEGTRENLRLLSARSGGVDVAIVQARVGSAVQYPGLVSLGSVSREPLWIFMRGAEAPENPDWLVGKRVSVGLPGSGSRVIADDLLVLSGLAERVERVFLNNDEAADALIAGEIDAALFVSAGHQGTVRRLLAAPGVHLWSLSHAVAFQRHFRDVKVIRIPQGLVDLSAMLPPHDVMTLAPLVGLVARADLHPAVIELLLRATKEIVSGGNLFNEPGKFPAPDFDDFPMSEDAVRFYEQGPGLLDRWLPYWASNLVKRMAILLVPLVTLAFPFYRFGPVAFRWHVRRQIYRWYRDLRRIEQQVRADPSEANRLARIEELDRLQNEVGSISVPLAYTEHLYHLRMHILFLRVLTETGGIAGAASTGSRRSALNRLERLMQRPAPAGPQGRKD